MVAVPLTDREMRPDVPICASAVTSAAGLRNTHSACAPADTYVRAVQLRFYQEQFGPGAQRAGDRHWSVQISIAGVRAPSCLFKRQACLNRTSLRPLSWELPRPRAEVA